MTNNVDATISTDSEMLVNIKTKPNDQTLYGKRFKFIMSYAYMKREGGDNFTNLNNITNPFP